MHSWVISIGDDDNHDDDDQAKQWPVNPAQLWPFQKGFTVVAET